MNMSPLLKVFLLSMAPISELRGAIPLAVWGYGIPPLKAFAVAIVGNLLAVVPLLLLIEPAHRLAVKFEPARKFFDWILERTRRKGKVVEKYEAIGLMLFVAIPLPGTGAWTGAFAAFIFDIPFKYAVVSISLGVLIAGIIVTAFVAAGLVGAIAAGVILTGLAAYNLYKKL